MKALHGLRMLDLTHVVSGPYAGMILADLGVEAIKIEPPGKGDSTRSMSGDDPKDSLNGMGVHFLTLNRNKKSVTLDLKSEVGLALFYELVNTADIVLDNFSVGVTERLKINHARLSAVNPRIITCTITGFGETGPEQNRPAFDIVAQALSGGMSITGEPGTPPMRSGLLIGDLGGGLMGVIGILSAVIARQSTGRGQHVDISMLDAQISLLNYTATHYFLSGDLPDQIGNGHVFHVPYNSYPTCDGYIIVAVVGDVFWDYLMQVLDTPDLDTPQNKQREGRTQNRAHIDALLTEVFKTNTQSYWVEKLRAARVPCAPVNNVAQALADVQVLARHMVVEIDHPLGGSIHAPGNPVKLSETHEETFTPPPSLGQHTDEVLKGLLGKSDDDLARLRAAGVI